MTSAVVGCCELNSMELVHLMVVQAWESCCCSPPKVMLLARANSLVAPSSLTRLNAAAVLRASLLTMHVCYIHQERLQEEPTVEKTSWSTSNSEKVRVGGKSWLIFFNVLRVSQCRRQREQVVSVGVNVAPRRIRHDDVAALSGKNRIAKRCQFYTIVLVYLTPPSTITTRFMILGVSRLTPGQRFAPESLQLSLGARPAKWLFAHFSSASSTGWLCKMHAFHTLTVPLDSW